MTNNSINLYTVNLSNGSASYVGKAPAGNASGLSFNHNDDRIYGSMDGWSGGGIYSFDPKNLAAGSTKLTGFPLGDTDVDAIAFDGVSKYYLVNETNSTNPGVIQNGIYIYDTATSKYSFANTAYTGGIPPQWTSLAGAAYIPAPGTLGLLTFFGLSAARRTR